MHLRPVFAETDLARILDLLRRHSFGVLVTLGARGLEASNIPFMVEPAEPATAGAPGFLLFGHLAAGNPQCAALDGGMALAVFTGPHAYISPSWYRSGPAVPTWDYAAVHVSGRLSQVEDPDAVATRLRALSAHDRDGFDFDAMPAAYRDKMLAGIRSFTLTPERVEAQWKMSQNRSAADRAGVIAALAAQFDPLAAEVAAAIAATMPPEPVG